jgi:hypothetical protein
MIFFKLPTSTGRVSFNEFCANQSATIWGKRLMGMTPLRLFVEMSKYYKYLQFPKLDGMLPSKLFLDKLSLTN